LFLPHFSGLHVVLILLITGCLVRFIAFRAHRFSYRMMLEAS
ncbi:Os10g0576750, partial [Oryza sativa Japonica Group]